MQKRNLHHAAEATSGRQETLDSKINGRTMAKVGHLGSTAMVKTMRRTGGHAILGKHHVDHGIRRHGMLGMIGSLVCTYPPHEIRKLSLFVTIADIKKSAQMQIRENKTVSIRVASSITSQMCS